MQFTEGDLEKDLSSSDEEETETASNDANAKHLDSLCLVEQVGFLPTIFLTFHHIYQFE